MGEVYSIFSYPIFTISTFWLCLFCVYLLLSQKGDIREALVTWMGEHRIIPLGVFLLFLCSGIFSNLSFYRWIGCEDVRTMPAGEYCYYVKVNREMDDQVYTLPAKIEVARSGYTYTTADGEEHSRSGDGFYLQTVYFNNGGYLKVGDAFEPGKSFGFLDQDYEAWECTVTDQRCSPAPFTETSASTDADTVRITFCVLILVLTYISLQLSTHKKEHLTPTSDLLTATNDLQERGEKMTYREMLMHDKPKETNAVFCGGCAGCPGDEYPGGPMESEPGCLARALGLDATEDDYEAACAACWNQTPPQP